MKLLKSSLSSVRKDRKVTGPLPNRGSLGCVPGVVDMIFFACRFLLAVFRESCDAQLPVSYPSRKTVHLERLKAGVSADDARIDLNDAVLNLDLVHDKDSL